MATLPIGSQIRHRPAAEKMTHIYVLKAEDDDRPRYVGSAVSPVQRFEKHRSDAKHHACNSAKSQWMAGVEARGSLVYMEIIDVCHYRDSNRIEREHIERLTEAGEQLVNTYKPPKTDRKECTELRARDNFFQVDTTTPANHCAGSAQ